MSPQNCGLFFKLAITKKGAYVMGYRLIMSKKELQRKSIFDLVKLGQITRLDASKRLYLSYCQTKRAYQRYLKEGDSGLTHRSRGKASPRAFPLKMKETVIAL
jgi:hypothetical protein